MSEDAKVKSIVEAALFASGRPLKLDELTHLFQESSLPVDRAAVRIALRELSEELEDRAIELVEVASGYRLQVRADYATWISRLWEERPAKYSRALLETLALIAYRQPVTRGEIEDIRGVTVSTSIMKTLQERDWIRTLGYREVPGRPALYGTTRTFLDDFNLRGLEDLPPLAEVRDIDKFHGDLFPEQGVGASLASAGPDAAAQGDDAGADASGDSGSDDHAENSARDGDDVDATDAAVNVETQEGGANSPSQDEREVGSGEETQEDTLTDGQPGDESPELPGNVQ